MKTFLVLALTVTAVFVWQRSNHDAAPATKPPIEAASVATSPARPVSEHNWAKHSLDRAHEVMDQVQQSRQQNEEPSPPFL